MPGRDELFSKLLFLINAPAQRLATVIAATGRDLAVVVNQAVEQNKFAGPAAAPEVKAEAKPEVKAEAAVAPVEEVKAAPVAEAAPAPDVTGAPQADPAQPETGEASQAEQASTEAPAEG